MILMKSYLIPLLILNLKFLPQQSIVLVLDPFFWVNF